MIPPETSNIGGSWSALTKVINDPRLDHNLGQEHAMPCIKISTSELEDEQNIDIVDNIFEAGEATNLNLAHIMEVDCTDVEDLTRQVFSSV